MSELITKARYLALAEVLGISEAEARDAKYEDAVANALQKVQEYPNAISDLETPDLIEKRKSYESVKKGQPSSLITHLKKIIPDIKQWEYTNWGVIYKVYFMLYGENKKVEQEKEEPKNTTPNTGDVDKEKVPEKEPEVKEESNQNKIENSSKEGEKKIMADTKTLDQIQEEQERMQNQGKNDSSIKDTGSNGVDPKQVAGNKEATDAAKEIVTKGFAMRKANFQNYECTNVICSRRPAKEVIPNADKAMGTIKNVENVLNSFTDKTGYQQDKDGTVRFTNVKPQHYEDAKAILAEIQAAQADPTHPIKINVNPDQTPTIIGLAYKKTKEMDPVCAKNADVIMDILENTIGAIHFAESSEQVQLKQAKPRESSKTSTKKDSGRGEKKDIHKGVSVLRYTDRKGLIEKTAMYHKEIDANKETEIRGGVKSELVVTYVKEAARPATDNSPAVAEKLAKYRIPLQTEQYKLVVNDQKLKDVFGDAEGGVGRTVQPYDPNNADMDKEMTNGLINILSVISQTATDTDNKFINEIQKAAREAQNARATQEADELGAETV